MRWGCIAVFLLAGCSAPLSREAPVDSDALARARAHTDLSASYYSRGQYGVALDEAEEALRSDARFVPAYNMLALIHMELKEDQKATQSFQRALKIEPQDAETNNNYGWFLCNRGKSSESLSYFERTLRDPLYATPHKALYNAGICARKHGDDATAESYFRKVLKLLPDEPQSTVQIADIFFRRNSIEGARTILQPVAQSPDASAEALWLGLRIERALKNRPEEAAFAMKLRRRFPNARETQLLQSGVYQ